MKIKRDEHSLYVRAGGYQFRPVHNQRTKVNASHVYKGGTVFSEGDEVKARHRAGTELAWVTKGDVRETWFSHGSYMEFPPGGGVKNLKPEQVWNPA